MPGHHASRRGHGVPVPHTGEVRFMFKPRTHFYSILAGLILSAGLQATDRIFVFPSGATRTVTALDVDSLATVGAFPASPSAFKAISVPDFPKTFIVSGDSERTLTEVSLTTLQVIRSLPLGAGAGDAALTGNGRRLLVSAGRLKVFDVSKVLGDPGSQVADVDVGQGPGQIEVSNDSSRAYVLTAGGVAAVDLTATPPSVVQIPVPGAQSMVFRPDNRNLLVLGSGGINVISTRTNTVSTAIPVGEIQNISGRILVTPDSTRAIVVNFGLAPFNNSQIVDLSSGTATPIGGSNQALSQIVIADNSTAFGIVPGTGTVLKIDLGTGAATALSLTDNMRSMDISPNGRTL